MARYALALAAEFGVDSDEVLSRVGLTQEAINQEGALLDCGMVTDTLEIAASLSRIPDLGMRLSRKLGFKHYGLIGMVAEHATTLEGAIRELARFVHVLNGALKVDITRLPEGYGLTLHIEQFGQYAPAQYRETLLTTGVDLCRHMFHPNWNPRRVNFVHGAMAPMSVYHQVMGGSVHFNQPQNMLCVSEEDFAAPSRNANTHVHSVAQGQLEELRHSLSADLMAKSDAMLRSMIPLGYTAIGDLANGLGMTERTLQRRLNERGVSFKQVLTKVRKEIVRAESQKGSVSATDLVTLLGFSEPSAVSRFLREQCQDILPASGHYRKTRGGKG